MTQHFYSNGKLLLTGEYAVLDGAVALALPTVYGQNLEITPLDEPVLNWKSLDHRGVIWFETQFPLPLNDDDHGSTIRTKLHGLLKAATQLKPDFLDVSGGFSVTTTMDFPRDWGLGSSSTLINNIAQWAGVDAHALLWATTAGSGYDIACAGCDNPITYRVTNQTPTITPVTFTPPFLDQLYFIHLNKKQDTSDGIKTYRTQAIPDGFVHDISALSRSVLTCTDLPTFNTLIETHEALIGEMLQTLPIKRRMFSDFSGAIKSLGAWGGDFILATGDDKTPDYFKSRGFKTIITYKNMIKGFDKYDG